MAGSTGLEPAASAVTGQRSNQLNYDPKTETSVHLRALSRRERAAVDTPSQQTTRCLHAEARVLG
jgi:hypothetical protein